MLVRISAEEAFDLDYPRCSLHRANVWTDWYWVDHRRVRRQRRIATPRLYGFGAPRGH